MAWDELPEDFRYRVLVNDEEQYSIWRGDVAIPAGWSVIREGTRPECLAFVEQVWTDIRPLSLRRRMAEVRA
jgi:MbtH protein